LWALFATEASACQTPAGIPCFTITYEHSIWALVKSPVRDLVTAEVTGTMAVRQDGSFVHRLQPSSRFAVRGSRDPAAASTTLYLAGAGPAAVRGSASSTDSRLPVFFYAEGGRPRRASHGDAGCRAVLEGIGQGLVQTGQTTMLGEPVVNWKLKTAYGDATASVAPGLDCQVLRIEAAEYRYGYLPVRKELFEAKTLRRGEPSAALFELPKESK